MSIFELLDTQTQNGHLIDIWTHRHKMDTELDNKRMLLKVGHNQICHLATFDVNENEK